MQNRISLPEHKSNPLEKSDPTSSPIRHVIIALDIDDTMILTHSGSYLLWRGGSVAEWKIMFSLISYAAAKQNIFIHFAVATARNSNDTNSMRSIVLDEQIDYFNQYPDDDTPAFRRLVGLGLKGWIHPELIYFVGHTGSKVTGALDQAKKYIEEKYQTSISSNDVWLIDDWDKHLQEAKDAGYQTILAVEPPNFNLPVDVLTLFKPIYSTLKLDDVLLCYLDFYKDTWLFARTNVNPLLTKTDQLPDISDLKIKHNKMHEQFRNEIKQMKSSHHFSFFEQLPASTQFHTLSFLDINDLVSFSQTSQLWRKRIMREPEIERNNPPQPKEQEKKIFPYKYDLISIAMMLSFAYSAVTFSDLVEGQEISLKQILGCISLIAATVKLPELIDAAYGAKQSSKEATSQNYLPPFTTESAQSNKIRSRIKLSLFSSKEKTQKSCEKTKELSNLSCSMN